MRIDKPKYYPENSFVAGVKDDLAEDDFDDDDDDKTSTAGGGGVGGGVFTSPELSGGQGAGAENGGDVERMRAFNVRPFKNNHRRGQQSHIVKFWVTRIIRMVKIKD